MSFSTVIANSLEYAFIGDEPERRGERWCALALAQVRDEITGEPVRGALTITVQRKGVIGKAGADGTFCLVVRPWLHFPPLLAASVKIAVTVESDGYIALRHTFTVNFDERKIAAPAPVAGDSIARLTSVAGIVAGDTVLFGPAGTTQEYGRVSAVNAVTNEITVAGRMSHAHPVGASVFPDNFAPAPAAQLDARRAPVVIAGRVVRRNTALNTSVPVPGASIAVTDFWRTQNAVRTHQPGAMTNINPALRSFALATASDVALERTTGVAFAGAMPLPPTPTQVKHLLAKATAGSQGATLSDRAGIGPGVIVQLDTDAERAEYRQIASVPPGGVDDPPRVGLAVPLMRTHRAGAQVERINAAAPPVATRAFRDDALPGDRTIFLDNVAGLALQGTLRLHDGAAPDEFHAFAQYATTSDANGYFRLPALHRVAQVHVTATAGPDVKEIDFQPDYDVPEQRLDVVFAV